MEGIKDHYRTDSEEYRALTQATFIELWKKGQIYLANRPNNYDWVSGTTIADAEITYVDLPTKLVYMKFGVKDSEQKNSYCKHKTGTALLMQDNNSK